ncbi:MAG: ADP-L-glycero-D-manno-heptose 6-epimerase [Gammaproteobacteria bacterium]|jgi:ADP-L-glycero-D-manno-heptose 6-epimerase
MIIVTGGAGFIGSNLVHELNRRGHEDVVVVDDLTDGHKYSNISGARIADYLDFEDFRAAFLKDEFPFHQIDRIYHLGACSTTTEWDGRFMMDLNYAYSRDLIRFSIRHDIPIVYASSAAVYGSSTNFSEESANEKPLNVYGYSKSLVDNFVARELSSLKSQVVGLRYFNVYGPREQHKGAMASVAFHLNGQLKESGKVRLFGASHGMAAGEQRRDFIFVDDAVNTTLWFADHLQCSGIFNCGTGRAESFNALAAAVLDWHESGEIEYVPFPCELLEAYQSNTQADLSSLRAAGCNLHYRSVSEGIGNYLDWLNS